MSNRRKSLFEVNHVAQFQLKQQEQSLSNEIDQNIRTLALVHPFSENVRALLVKGAFLKANKPAFHHVIQYLVIIISSVDFRKRFRWPILSSRDEGDFRNAALSYFNACHSNFKWNFGPFKMQVVLFPGGIEFMKIVVELSKAAMLKILKDNDSLHLINANGITLHEAKAKLQATEEAYEELELLQSKIRDLSASIAKKTNHLQELLCDISVGISVAPILLEQSILSIWQDNQHKQINEQIWPSLQVLDEFSSKCYSFEQKLMNTKPQHVFFDKDKMNAAGFLQMSAQFSPHIDYDQLLTFLKDIMPRLLNSLHFKPPWSISQLTLESELLEKHLERAHSLLLRIDAITLDFPVIINGTNRSSQAAAVNMIMYWHEKLVLTPIIKRPMKNVRRHKAIWDTVAYGSPIRTIPVNLTNSDDTSGFADGFGLGDTISMQPTCTKLDPIAMLSSVMHRTKGFNKNSPRRTTRLSSPSGLTNNNMAAFNSTMIRTRSPRAQNNQTNFSSIRKALF